MEPLVPTVDDWNEKGPPWAILVIAALAVTAAFLLLYFTEFGMHVVGYALGSVVCTALVVAFVKVDTARRTSRHVVYLDHRWARYLWSGVLIAGIVSSALHAWSIATTLAVR